MRDIVKSIKDRDPALRSVIEVVLYPSFWAILFHRIAHRMYKMHLFFLARLLSQISRIFTGIEIHPGAVIGKGLFIDHGMGVVIGETCIIGDNVTVYQGVTLGGTGKEKGKRHPTIGNNVLIGSGAKVLGPFTVGDNARIGAGSVVLQEVPSDCTVVGIPGRIIKREQDTAKECIKRLDHSLPDPVYNELLAMENRIAELEKKISDLLKDIEGSNYENI